MATAVERLIDPMVLAREPRLQRLFYEAFDGSPVFPGGFPAMVEDLVALIADPQAVFLVGVEDGEPLALSIVLLPTSKLTPYPQIMHFYNGGGLPLRKILTKTTAEVVRSFGYTKFWAVNATGKPDSVWARMFRLAGDAHPIGGLMEFDLQE